MEQKNVYQRIHAVMQDVEYLSKDDKVSTGKSSYKALSEEKATTTVRPSLIRHGLVIIPIEQGHARTDEIVKSEYGERINRISTVDVKYRIQNIDAPDDYVIVSSSGTGVDTQDKGVGKAMTYAFKYMLLRTFAIPTGDDPDKVSSDTYTEQLTGGNSVYANKLNELRADIKRAVPEPKFREAASMKRFGKEFMQLDENELSEILKTLQSKEAKVTMEPVS